MEQVLQSVYVVGFLLVYILQFLTANQVSYRILVHLCLQDEDRTKIKSVNEVLWCMVL
jgi:hypothetical protein